ncbi:MAG TPA: RraA family protein [Candidatus Bipolaricaulis anaerobius]|nr:RraA family protein [Candidatus Bipolaricaulis anaerobius]HNS23707.1 RraA family protein [Candidatus Bipolaricaulis anaerobius]
MGNMANDQELCSLIKGELFTAVVGDVLDRLNCRNQFLPPWIRPLRDDMIIAGRAMPVLEADCTGVEIAALQVRKPFGLMLEALDDLKKNDVYICTGSSHTYALWGENMTTRAMKLGAAGAVLDGFSRDTRGILSLGFPVFSCGSYAQDQSIRGRVIDYGCPITFANGVVVHPGDVVFGDIDGVLIIPKEISEKVIESALERVHGENLVREALTSGMPAREAFQKYGVM